MIPRVFRGLLNDPDRSIQLSNITYAAYLWHVQESEFFQRAKDDVFEAFEYYMRNHNEGRGFVLIGHSQGSHHLTELLREKFDNNEALRAQLVSAVLMGPPEPTTPKPWSRRGSSALTPGPKKRGRSLVTKLSS